MASNDSGNKKTDSKDAKSLRQIINTTPFHALFDGRSPGVQTTSLSSADIASNATTKTKLVYDEPLSSIRSSWIASVGSFYNWRVMRRDGLTDILRLVKDVTGVDWPAVFDGILNPETDDKKRDGNGGGGGGSSGGSGRGRRPPCGVSYATCRP
ncbi:hypothetical protein B0T24DRAFT_592653 [Lasiosphaeria ovina]|uniref:Uncharacterized protein n=1 Tax=Lasiosphaeria ovina TaxID=92902 RepID=A0AAE0NAQ1_9PEZI|nr:hypothetical protein B0T24DRAFT_592653 [Lasiosphaeria ovina]